MCVCVCAVSGLFFLSKQPSLFCLIHFGGAWGLKTTFDGRRLSMEDDLQWKTTFDGRRPSMEEDLRWKTNFDGRRPLMEDDLQWKTTFDGRRPSMEDDLPWKTTFQGRQPLIECLVYYLKKNLTTPHLDSRSTTDPKFEILSII